MSIYGHYTQQYYGDKIIFPENSFLISGISFYQDNCLDIKYDTELKMELEPELFASYIFTLIIFKLQYQRDI